MSHTTLPHQKGHVAVKHCFELLSKLLLGLTLPLAAYLSLVFPKKTYMKRACKPNTERAKLGF